MSVAAYIALGANLGDRRGNIEVALGRLGGTAGVRVTSVSGLMENPAVGGPAGSPAFLNAVAAVETSLSAAELLELLLSVEKSLGRVREERWGPRVIDLDLVLYGDEVIESAGLTVPHPLMHERRFVLGPLAEIAPGVVHPTLRRSAAELLAELDERA
jgi:2-amino-4-hydroxy-6-hydroxymethyldihydropteridine diphosphokinase